MAEPEQDEVEKVQSFIKDQVETYFNELAEKHQSTPQQQAQPMAKSQQDQAKDQLRELISPYVDPSLQAAQFAGADAQDYVKFYTNNNEAAEYTEEIEKRFKILKDANRPTTRADILRHMRGDEYEKDPDKFIEKVSVKRKQQLERAELASDIGAGGLGKTGKDHPVFSKLADYNKLQGDDLSTALKDVEKALDGVAF